MPTFMTLMMVVFHLDSLFPVLIYFHMSQLLYRAGHNWLQFLCSGYLWRLSVDSNRVDCRIFDCIYPGSIKKKYENKKISKHLIKTRDLWTSLMPSAMYSHLPTVPWHLQVVSKVQNPKPRLKSRPLTSRWCYPNNFTYWTHPFVDDNVNEDEPGTDCSWLRVWCHGVLSLVSVEQADRARVSGNQD